MFCAKMYSLNTKKEKKNIYISQIREYGRNISKRKKQ